MRIDFDPTKLEKYFMNDKKLSITFGDMAKKIRKILNHLEAAPCFKTIIDLGLGKPHTLEGNLKGCFGIYITANYRLIVKPMAKDLSYESLRECVAVVVKGVDDYHGGKSNWIIP